MFKWFVPLYTAHLFSSHIYSHGFRAGLNGEIVENCDEAEAQRAREMKQLLAFYSELHKLKTSFKIETGSLQSAGHSQEPQNRSMIRSGEDLNKTGIEINTSTQPSEIEPSGKEFGSSVTINVEDSDHIKQDLPDGDSVAQQEAKYKDEILQTKEANERAMEFENLKFETNTELDTDSKTTDKSKIDKENTYVGEGDTAAVNLEKEEEEEEIAQVCLCSWTGLLSVFFSYYRI